MPSVTCGEECPSRVRAVVTSTPAVTRAEVAAPPVLAAIQEALEAYEEYRKALGEELKGLRDANRSLLDSSLEAAFDDFTPEVGALHHALSELESFSARARLDT
jgi:hypothetical protein